MWASTVAWWSGRPWTDDHRAREGRWVALRERVRPRAHYLRGAAFLNRMYFGEIPRDAANSARALELAETALRIAPHDELAHWLMAGALCEVGRLEDAVAECERGLEINPSCSLIVARLGTYLGAVGRPQDAVEACRLALRLNPRDPENFWRHSDLAVAHFVAADYDAALQESKSVIRLRPAHPLASLHSAIIWAAAAAALEKVDEAPRAVEYCLVSDPICASAT